MPCIYESKIAKLQGYKGACIWLGFTVSFGGIRGRFRSRRMPNGHLPRHREIATGHASKTVTLKRYSLPTRNEGPKFTPEVSESNVWRAIQGILG